MALDYEKSFPIVAIGASAGGLIALQHFFEKLPEHCGMAFVVVQHLSADFKSKMGDLLSRHTGMKIQQVSEGLALEPDQVYLNISLTQMTVKDGVLHLIDIPEDRHVESPIDVFFKSLAEDAKDRAVGVVLSGTGKDGSDGIRAIARCGGLTLIQDPATAQFDSMPQSSIDTGVGSFILAPEEMPAILLEHTLSPIKERPGGQSRAELLGEKANIAAIFRQLQQRYSLDFGKYKLGTVGRRIGRRMEARQVKDLTAYLDLLESDPDELEVLYHDLLIGVTEFFRDEKAFRHLEKKVIPELFAALRPGQDMRVWSAGCATGEEAYSLAILLMEQAQRQNFTGKILVFATDMHKRSLEAAAQGVFTRSSLEKVGPERLNRFFYEVGKDLYKVRPELRRLLTFAHHDVTVDTPFSKLSLVCCRNLLIYLQPAAQKKVLSLFQFALEVNGVLFLGSSEGVGPFTGEFESVSTQHKMFRKVRDLKQAVEFDPGRKGNLMVLPRQVVQTPPQQNVSLDRQVLHDYDVLLERHLPPGILVDDKLMVVHCFGDVARYLKQLKGRFENDILKLTEDNLHFALSASLQKARKSGQRTVARNVRIDTEGEEALLDVTVDPIAYQRRGGSHFHIYFERIRPAEQLPAPDELDLTLAEPDIYCRQHLADLELELQSAREDLLATQENLQATIEELNATNEEVQATNEELQSTNEELNSANEELQSTNEELYSVNSEFERSNIELKELNDDHVNLLSSIDSAIIFLDARMCIRRFNPASSAFFKLLPQDVGRPIDHISYQLANQGELLADIKSVLANGKPIEKEVQTEDGNWMISRITPFRTNEGQAAGAVITFTNITRVKESERQISALNVELEARVTELQQTYRNLQRESEERARAAAELREKDQLMIQQSRLAAMGEMLGNIAHQWRQPLNTLALRIQELWAYHRNGKLSAEILKESTDKSMELIEHMSQTIEDFRNFLTPDKEKVEFRVEQVVLQAVSLIRDDFNANRIAIEHECSGDLRVFGYPNEYQQVVLNILANAKDAFLEQNREDRRVVLRVWEESGKTVLTITDNAGGIPEQHLDRIFEAYYSTKSQGRGSGVGLFMSSNIIEKNMGGRLTARNVDGGAEFRIEV